MTEAEFYEMLGRKQARIEKLEADYSNTLRELGLALTGEIAGNRVLVNLTDMTFSRVPEGQSIGMPATINGVPVCVVGTDWKTRIGELEGELGELKAKELMRLHREQLGGAEKLQCGGGLSPTATEQNGDSNRGG